MKTVIAILSISLITLFSIEFEKNAFTNIEFFDAEMNTIKLSIANTEHKIITAEMDMENILEGTSNGIN